MPDTTYEYLQGVFNGEHPIQRQNPQPGESEYYYITPNQNPNKPINELQTTDISSPQQNNRLTLQNIISEAFDSYPTVRMGDALGTLYAAKQEMDAVKKDGYDNYAHRLGMCLNAQKGLDSAVYSLGWGVLKEIKDIVQKAPKKGINSAWNDTIKDMKNNMEGLQYGLTHPHDSCRTWLKDLDYGVNKWKK